MSEFQNNNTPLDEYISLLATHDWDFLQKQSATAYKAGAISLRKLQELKDGLDPDGLIWRLFDVRNLH